MLDVRKSLKLYIDFVLTSNIKNTLNFEILDPNMNLSDHLPIAVSTVCSVPTESKKEKFSNKLHLSQLDLRWDKADNNSYYLYTREHLQPTLNKVLKSPDNFLADCIEIVAVLNTGAKLYVPAVKNIYIIKVPKDSV